VKTGPFGCRISYTNPPWPRGWSTAAALPIGLVHGAGGVLNVYSDKTAFFDEAARGLLRELADDIGFALRGFAREGQRKRAEDALKRSEDEFHTLAEAVPQIVWVTSKDGRSLYVNRRWADYTGRPVEASQGDGWLEQFHPDDRDEIEHSWRAAATAGKPYSRETRLRGKDAGYRWFLVRGAPSRDERGDVDKWFGTCTDIDDLKTAEIKLSRLNRVHAVLSGINTLILHADDRARLFDEACRIAVEAGGFRLSMMCVVDTSAMKISPVASASKDDAILAMVEGVLSSSEDAPKTMCALAVRETRVVVAQDMLHDMRVVFGPRYAACGVLSLAVFPVIVAGEIECLFSLYAEDSNFFDKEEMALLTDMVDNIAFAIDHIRQADRLDRLAYYDDLTGLANRRLFLERVGQYIRGENNRRVRIAVLIVDLSRFKNINHRLGRPAGDALLKLSASWLADNRGDANLIARLGADQFGVVLPDVAPGRDLGRLLEDMLKALTAHPFRLSESVIHVSAAFGVALYPSDGADAETLLRNAETALKLAKVNGERYLFYAATMSSATEGKLGLETRLRQALEKQEFVLHYQPKIGLASGAVISAEALIRWNDPQRGLVAPNEFIPSLEETGLIYEVGKWALATATKDSLRWRAAGLPIGRIAVNVSPLELRDRDFVADLGKILSVDPQAGAGLELEITEGVIMADVSASISSLQAIRAMGVTIAIDDFGTGFSSLSYLTRLPIDTLKIDRSFVVQMTETPEGLTLVSTIIGLARGLKLKVVAEGVEIEEQFRLLRLLGCDEMQGFFFSEPIPADVFEARYLLH
jgi:diguanylate cyclase (GGDEF)-like protein/PAS domain S-box-containing protein